MRLVALLAALATSASAATESTALSSKEWLLQHCDRCSAESIDALDADDVDRIIRAVKLPADTAQLDSTADAKAAAGLSQKILKLLDETSAIDTLQLQLRSFYRLIPLDLGIQLRLERCVALYTRLLHVCISNLLKLPCFKL